MNYAKYFPRAIAQDINHNTPLPLPSQAQLKELLDYDPDTGVFTWLERPLESFAKASVGKMWNGRFAGKPAGSVHSSGYLLISLGDKTYKAHRLAWRWVTGQEPSDLIHHANKDRLDNSFANLRDVTQVESSRARALHSNNRSGARGVSWSKTRGLWRAEINGDSRKRELGFFESFDDAVAARKAAELIHGYS
jgi:hypothetical protein